MISIVIATFNRCADLRLTLQSIAEAVPGAGVPVEVLVMDNNSTDATRQVVDGMGEELDITYAFEPNPGKSRALNSALGLAKGELFLFTDDDVLVDAHWLAAYAGAMQAHPERDFFGGRVISAWQCDPPQWFRDHHHWLQVTPKLDWGEPEQVIDSSNRRFFLGANMAVRRRAFDEGLRFNENFGPLTAYGSPDARHGSEDGLLQFDLLARGATGLYLPKAIVHHRDKADRMTRAYVRWFYRQHAREEILCGSLAPSRPQILGVPRYVFRDLLESAVSWCLSHVRGGSTAWVRHEVNFIMALERFRTFRYLSTQPGCVPRSEPQRPKH